ncbi:hypothetical protein [Pseudoduganella ginsengisoli]|uniref:Uncharacterized protein n=1 Tax=Pseudoduganella ginsengisoli TaxID=1462440 RepID=A0A6L6PT50_9BURK|nr:hypothetical protein [Pseudoduganella ginsengisoli]MTW00703.1 hypothetical protein [Pseudoduganella ginsengisoli]
MYRCVAEVCGKGFPRKVNYCPFCGTRQGAASSDKAPPAARWADSGGSAKADAGAKAAAALAAAKAEEAQARLDERVRADAQAKADALAKAEASAKAEAQAKADAARAEALAQARDTGAGSAASRQPPEQLTSDQQNALERLNKLRGVNQPAAPAANPFQPQQGNNAQPSRPPLRKPISKSTWVSVAIVLGLIWFLARPSDPTKKLQARVDKAVEMVQDCKIDAARNELASLKSDKASAQQLKTLQDAINANAKKCDAKRHRAKAWSDLRPQLESALQSGAIDLADRRLAAFTKTWGADDESREMDGRIDVRKGERLLNEADACIKRADRACAEAKLQAAEKLQRSELKTRVELLRESLSELLKRTVLEQAVPAAAAPAAIPSSAAPARPVSPAQPAPSAQPSQQAQQGRKLLAEAQRELAQGNYKAAMDKANICATMIDEGNRECIALKNRAERMNRDLMNCVAAGRDWIDDRCQ